MQHRKKRLMKSSNSFAGWANPFFLQLELQVLGSIPSNYKCWGAVLHNTNNFHGWDGGSIFQGSRGNEDLLWVPIYVFQVVTVVSIRASKLFRCL